LAVSATFRNTAAIVRLAGAVRIGQDDVGAVQRR
jgi:hypothetical protein